MLELGSDFIFELVSIDAGATAASTCRIAGLEHEVGDYTVEEEIVVVAAAGESFEVFAGLRRNQLCKI